MVWSFFEVFFSFYIILVVCTVLLVNQSAKLRLEQKETYAYFLFIFLIVSFVISFLGMFVFKTNFDFILNTVFFNFLIFFFFFISLVVLLFIVDNLKKASVKEEFFILLYFFILGSYLLFKVNDLGILYLVIELPRVSGLCFSSKCQK